MLAGFDDALGVQVVVSGFAKAELHLRAGARLIDRIVENRSVEYILPADGLPLARESFGLDRPSSLVCM